jgi:hypothetical protein
MQVQSLISEVEANWSKIRRKEAAECWWLTPVILTTWEVEIGRIAV